MRKNRLISGLLCLAVAVSTFAGVFLYVSAQEESPESEEILLENDPDETEPPEPEDEAGDVEDPDPEEPEEPSSPEPPEPSEPGEPSEPVPSPEVSPEPAPPSEELDDLDKEVEEDLPVNESSDEPSEEYPPAWAESGQSYIRGNLALAEQIRVLDVALDAQIEAVRSALELPSRVQVSYDADNLVDVLAVYAVKHGMTEDFPYGIEIADEASQHELLSVFWSMTRVGGSVQSNSRRLHVYRDGYESYGLSEEQKEQAGVLVGKAGNAALRELYETSILSTLSDEEFAAVQKQLDGVSGERRSVLLAALSLEGKVKYFWGGKSYYTGWDNRWGQLRTVTSEGSRTTGTARPFGLDCSGFVTWAFINAQGSRDVAQYIGNGTTGQWINSKGVTWEEVQPGDLVFYNDPSSGSNNHVGIVLGRDDRGNVRIVHCAGGSGVVVTGKLGFRYARSPYAYGE